MIAETLELLFVFGAIYFIVYYIPSKVEEQKDGDD
jgi:hypothetical protein